MNNKGLVIAMLSFLAITSTFSTEIDDQLFESVNLSYDSQDLIREVINQYPHESEEFLIDAIIVIANERGINLEGDNKNGLAIRNAIRVVVGVLRPGTANAPTHDGRGRLPSK